MPGMSDHNLVYAILGIKVKKKYHKILEIRNFKNFVEDEFHKDAENISWHLFKRNL